MALVYISSVTASSSATLEFTSGIDSTYNEYQFHLLNIHAATDNSALGFQFNAGGSDFDDLTIVSTFFKAEHSEGGAGGVLSYTGSGDMPGTGYQRLSYSQQIDTDEAFSGVLTLFNPSSTTYQKLFRATGNYVHHSGHYSQNIFVGGYVETTAAINQISFKMESGNIDAGSIHMYGVG